MTCIKFLGSAQRQFVAIMLAMAVSLANRFTTMLNELEYEVAERTAELSAAVLAEKLRQGIAGNMFEFSGHRLSITITFGVASHSKGETLDACIARADTALYHGKEQGRNNVMVGSYKGLTLVS